MVKSLEKDEQYRDIYWHFGIENCFKTGGLDSSLRSWQTQSQREENELHIARMYAEKVREFFSQILQRDSRLGTLSITNSNLASKDSTYVSPYSLSSKPGSYQMQNSKMFGSFFSEKPPNRKTSQGVGVTL